MFCDLFQSQLECTLVELFVPIDLSYTFRFGTSLVVEVRRVVVLNARVVTVPEKVKQFFVVLLD